MLFPFICLFASTLMMAQPGFGQQHFGVVHPIATNTFPVSHREDSPPQQPEEEDLTSELGPSEPVVLVEQPLQQAVTLPFVFQRPPSAIPTSYLRPLLVDFPSDNSGVTYTAVPIRQTRPWYGPVPSAVPAVEDLTSPLPVQTRNSSSGPFITSENGAAVTLPILVAPPKKPSSFLRPIFPEESVPTENGQAQPAILIAAPVEQADQEPIRQTRPIIPTRNAAVTLPFALQPAEEEPIKNKKPTSFLRPIFVPTDAQSDNAAAAPVKQNKLYIAVPAEEDLTSPVAIQQQQASPVLSKNVAAVPLPYYLKPVAKPSSYLRPWIVDDSPAFVASPVPITNRFVNADATDAQQPGVARPLIATLLPEERPSFISSGHQRQQPVRQLRPWIVQEYNQPQAEERPATVVVVHDQHNYQPVKQTKPWFVPVVQIKPIIPTNEREPSYYELVRNPSGQEEIYGRSWIKEKFHTLVKSKQSNVDKFGESQQEPRVPFFGMLGGGGIKFGANSNATLVYTKSNPLLWTTSTLYSSSVITVTTTIVNAYCFSSLVDPLFPMAPWCAFRKKRSSGADEDREEAIISIDGDIIDPSEVEKIMITALPSEVDELKVMERIMSSITTPVDDNQYTTTELPNSEGRFLNIGAGPNNNLRGPTTTITITSLSVVTEISITGTTTITFAGGTCVPRCLQNLPTCVAVKN